MTGGELERRWDDAVEAAWRELRQRLADRVAQMVPGERLWVEQSLIEDGQVETGQGCVVVADGGVLSVEAVDVEGRSVGWWDMPADHVDGAAVRVVEVLRELFGVLHPVWLVADGDFDPVPASPAQAPAPAPAVDPSADEVMTPRSVDDVRLAVELAVRELYDEAPEWDDDGDLPLPSERCVVWVTLSKVAPRILLHCALLEEVADERAALAEVNLLNQKEFGLAFILRDRRVTVSRELGLDAVLPSALEAEIGRLLGQVDQWARDLDQRLRTGNDEPAAERRPGRWATAYAVMVELEKADRGSLGPAALARTFDNDTGLLLRALRVTEQKRRELRAEEREARRLGKHRRESVLRARQDYLRGLATRLRAALRLLVDAPVRKTQLDQLSLFGEDGCGRALES